MGEGVRQKARQHHLEQDFLLVPADRELVLLTDRLVRRNHGSVAPKRTGGYVAARGRATPLPLRGGNSEHHR